MKFYLLLSLLLSFLYVSAAAEISLVRGGRSSYVIVEPDEMIPGTPLAVKELRNFIHRGTGCRLSVIREKDWDGRSPALVLGATRYAVGKGIHAGQLSSEEWLLRAMPDGNLVITGGYPRGVLYAVYEFLERFVGCRFPAVRVEYVPRSENLSVPGNLKIQGRPYFNIRSMFFALRHNDYGLFFLRNRVNNHDYNFPSLGFSYRYGSPYCHTFWQYSRNFPSDHPEYFALNARGERPRAVSGMGPGQVCMSNPQVRKLFAEQLRNFIRKEREIIDREGMKEPYPVIYDISANDNPHKCLCPECLAREKKYGAYSGVMLEFINAIADDIRKDYPDVLLQTFAYLFTEKPPKGIRARPNVLIQIAYMGTEFISARTVHDTFRELGHPNNRTTLQNLKQWARASDRLGVWDYWKIYLKHFSAPCVLVDALPKIMKAYAECGVEKFFIETEIPENDRLNICSFLDLKNYLGMRLMLDPHLDSRAVIRDFMVSYYGPAAGEMQRYLEFLEEKQAEEKRPLGSTPIICWSYLTEDFFRRAELFLDRAEKAAAGNQEVLRRIGQERIPVDMTRLQMRRHGRLPDFDTGGIAARLKKNYSQAIQAYCRGAEWLRQGEERWNRIDRIVARRIDHLTAALPVPVFLKGRKYFDCVSTDLGARSFHTFVEDSDACLGCARKLGAEASHTRPMSFGIYDNFDKKLLVRRTLKPEEVRKDGKYHWYHLGRTVFTPGSYLFVHSSWLIQWGELLEFLGTPEPDQMFDVYVSLKMTGPAYVPGTVGEDAVYLDRLVFAETAECGQP